ncbi:MAG: hormogonium polysaccharide secretion pseudopilin HpsB [Komarekiella atlantica HA4396-MV6]|jgi:prepilin-type N-terminal cleavage/methylation domain-containing protein|nr:hormogonium polysaccharide secretion pseudopilin HpsB [Komarekiella atlantica HA4396-MV6]
MIKRKQQQISCSFDESGFTIIESLVALLVVAILLTAIAPVIVLATATRVQSRRVELATRAVKTYIDGVRTGAIAAPSAIISRDPANATTTRNVSNSTQAAAYLISSTDMPPPTSSTGLYCFTKNGNITSTDCTDKPFEFYIQAAQIKVTGSQPNDGYRLGIRVYRANADFTKTLTVSDETKKTQQTFTGGLGERQAPLIEMTTDIASTNTSFQALCQRLGTATNSNCQ